MRDTAISGRGIKNVIRMDFRIGLLVVFVWSIMSPYLQNLKGLMEPEVLSLLMIAASVAMEVLALLNKRTTFKSSTMYLIMYDLFFLTLIIIGYLFFSDKQFIFMVSVAAIPYYPLVQNVKTKYRALLGERYPKYFVEHVSTKMSILQTRIGLLSFVLAGLISILAPSPKYVVVVFIIASAIQSIWSIYVYRKYYGIFNR